MSEIAYTKFFGMYGKLVMLITKEIYFLPQMEENNDTYYNVTQDFEII